MFFLKKLITYFVLLPPGNFVLLLTLLGIYLLRRKLKKVGLSVLFTALALYLLSLEPIAVTLIKPLEDSFSVPPEKELLSCDAIVVLSGGIKVGVPFLGLKNDLGEDTFKRTVGAYLLYRLRERPIIVSGYSVKDRLSEAKVMKELLTQLGVKKELIFEEGKSRDTFENARFVRKLVKEKAFKRVCLVTSAYHMRRSYFLFLKAGFGEEEILPVPVDFKASLSPFSVYKLLPSAYWFRVSAQALKEYFGLIYYSLKW